MILNTGICSVISNLFEVLEQRVVQFKYKLPDREFIRSILDDLVSLQKIKSLSLNKVINYSYKNV